MIVKLAICAAALLTVLPAEAEDQPQQSAEAKPDKPSEQLDLLQIELNVVKYTNDERARRGLPKLKVDPELMKSARSHAAWMTRNRRLIHTTRPVAENIAMGQSHSSSAVNAWMNSRGHRANILNGSHGRIGVAAYRTAGGTIYWCQQFLR
ncbi:MAG: hypothetical protein HQ567_04315 [Candidatus Nealsonbacteria bacterium]|nr:hypothetical protein [Candidatus Nealsonbacteria bacterium]